MLRRISWGVVALTITIILMAVSWAALAQPGPIPEAVIPLTHATPAAAPTPLIVQNEAGGWDLTPLLSNLQQFLAAVLTLVVTAVIGAVAQPLNKYFGTKIEAERIVKDLKMDQYSKLAAQEAIRWARQQSGVTDEQLKNVDVRNPFLALAASYLFRLDSDVWRWAANTEKGVMQYIEAQLHPDAALPPNIVAGVGPVPAEVKP